MKLTTNYSLKKPEGSDVVNIDDFNYNADIIDSKFLEFNQHIENLRQFTEYLNSVLAGVLTVAQTNKANISNLTDTTNSSLNALTTKVDNGQTYRLTNKNGDYQEYTGSINSLTNGGFYASASTSGAPSSESVWWYYEVIVHPHRGNLLQKATSIDGTISYYRWGGLDGANWGAWRSDKSVYADGIEEAVKALQEENQVLKEELTQIQTSIASLTSLIAVTLEEK